MGFPELVLEIISIDYRQDLAKKMHHSGKK